MVNLTQQKNMGLLLFCRYRFFSSLYLSAVAVFAAVILNACRVLVWFLSAKSEKPWLALRAQLPRQPLLLWFLYNHSLCEGAAEPTQHLPAPLSNEFMISLSPYGAISHIYINNSHTQPVSILLHCSHMLITHSSKPVLKHICICLHRVMAIFSFYRSVFMD